MIVVKKIVGSYAGKLQENGRQFQELYLVLTQSNGITLAALLKGKKEYAAAASDKNLFFAMEKALSRVSALVRE